MSSLKKRYPEGNLSLLVIVALLFLAFFILVGSRKGKPNKSKNKGVQVREESVKVSGNAVELLEPGLFRIKIPEALNYPPEKILQEVNDSSSQESSTATFYRYQSAEGQETYQIGHIRLPEAVFQAKSIQIILDDLTKGEVSWIQGTLKKEFTNLQSSYSATREITTESVTDSLFAREVLVVNRPYAFVLRYTSNNKNNLESKKAQAFFESFELFQTSAPKTIIINPSQKPNPEQSNVSLLNPRQ